MTNYISCKTPISCLNISLTDLQTYHTSDARVSVHIFFFFCDNCVVLLVHCIPYKVSIFFVSAR